MVSVIIPSRNEKYLEKTIRNVLENARGEIEVLAMLDGYVPDPQINIDDERVKFIYYETSIGQRQCVNAGAKLAKGEFIMKLDAHCAVDEGFDVKLAADCEKDWTVIPRMYNLDIETWQPKWHKRTDYMYISSMNTDKPFRATYYGSRQPKNGKLIDDTMCNMGPGWFMRKDRFWELGGLDEGHGGWGQMGVEVSCKAWLSGGRQVVNKKTWFAHWFRGGAYNEKFSPGFPYRISGNAQERARKYSRDLWLGNKWDKRVHDFQWLVDKFQPPGWDVSTDVYIPRKAISHVHGRAVRISNLFRNLQYYWDTSRKYRADYFVKTAIPFFKDVRDGKEFTDDELRSYAYYQYLKDGMKSRHFDENCIKVMRDGIRLYHNIKENGMRTPIEMWVEDGKYNISRGTRRIVILHLLKRHSNTVIRIYKNKEFMEKFRIKQYPDDDSVGGIATKQFAKWSWKATDKYWIHDYPQHYDKHIGYLKDKAEKVLEIGVQHGGSLRLWEEFFTKAHIYGVDLDISKAKMAGGKERITLIQGSQIDEQFNKEQVIPQGPFDLIVDDASHRAEHQKKGFELLWSSVKSGGWYVIEDLFYRNYHNNKDTVTMMDVLKHQIDEMNFKGEIEEIHFYYNICFLKRR